MTEAVTPDDIQAAHKAALESMSSDQYLAVARELLATMIREKANARDVFVTRMESLEAVFEAEANAVNAGAKPKVDFFLPLDNALPLQGVR